MFQSDKPQQDRAYNEMLKPIRARIESADITELCERTGAMRSGEASISLQTFGKEVNVSLPDCTISPTLESWHGLVLLHYLCNADGTRPQGE